MFRLTFLGERIKKVVKTLHKYKYIHKLFVRTAEVPVHKFSNCIATQSISPVRQKPQHEFRLITAHVHINMYICIYTHFEIRAVGTRAGDTSNERLQGANENYNEMHFTVTSGSISFLKPKSIRTLFRFVCFAFEL